MKSETTSQELGITAEGWLSIGRARVSHYFMPDESGLSLYHNLCHTQSTDIEPGTRANVPEFCKRCEKKLERLINKTP